MSLLMVDLDGTVRKPLSGQIHIQHPKDQGLIEGVNVALSAYNDDWMIVGITNQGGVEAGYKSMQACIQEQQHTLHLLPMLREIYFCPDFAGKKCFRVTLHNAHNLSKTQWSGQYRKPGAGMLQLAMAKHHHSPATSVYVGDRTEDEQAAHRVGVRFQWASNWIEQHQEATSLKLEETTP
ncbi:HAD-IIIA family hydrolase [Leptolyngbya sp. FACHB-261]|uniref:HAD-IIIA family hydrolase n=1 Tax=Leptolyngbya sp. FACHB-261 TaxID=2692806 RepID=UPI00168246D3|nr:HAD-IIIA family hydrolase [Leptolyngbya sp. FACHB-261]MBD2100348.1 HAD-IIIA family hydrolase [Leptolyngbya sp. FACHB-261]